MFARSLRLRGDCPQLGSLRRMQHVERHPSECRVMVQKFRGIDIGQYLLRVRKKSVTLRCPSDAVQSHGLAVGLLHLHQDSPLRHADIKPKDVQSHGSSAISHS